MTQGDTGKYDKYVKAIPIEYIGEGGFRQGAILDKEWLGFDVRVKYGAYSVAGRMGKPPYTPHVHDFDQVLLFAGSDMDDIGDLHAEVEFSLGENLETHISPPPPPSPSPKACPTSPPPLIFSISHSFIMKYP